MNLTSIVPNGCELVFLCFSRRNPRIVDEKTSPEIEIQPTTVRTLPDRGIAGEPSIVGCELAGSHAS